MSTPTSFVRGGEDRTQAIVALANETLRQVRAGTYTGDPELLKESLLNLADLIEGFDPHLAGDLEDAAELLVY